KLFTSPVLRSDDNDTLEPRSVKSVFQALYPYIEGNYLSKIGTIRHSVMPPWTKILSNINTTL
ncbi:hypothetical protein HHI36_009231, partial [Cryptolaemus montrouzieri]